MRKRRSAAWHTALWTAVAALVASGTLIFGWWQYKFADHSLPDALKEEARAIAALAHTKDGRAPTNDPASSGSPEAKARAVDQSPAEPSNDPGYVAMGNQSEDQSLSMSVRSPISLDIQDKRQVHFQLRLNTAGGPKKLFVPLYGGLQGWSMVSSNGNHCRPLNTVDGLPVYDTTSTNSVWTNHIPEMPVITSVAPKFVGGTMECAATVQPNDRFYLSVQIHALPGNAVPGAGPPTVLNYGSAELPIK